MAKIANVPEAAGMDAAEHDSANRAGCQGNHPRLSCGPDASAKRNHVVNLLGHRSPIVMSISTAANTVRPVRTQSYLVTPKNDIGSKRKSPKEHLRSRCAQRCAKIGFGQIPTRT